MKYSIIAVVIAYVGSTLGSESLFNGLPCTDLQNSFLKFNASDNFFIKLSARAGESCREDCKTDWKKCLKKVGSDGEACNHMHDQCIGN